jgi:chromosome segregation ATPase
VIDTLANVLQSSASTYQLPSTTGVVSLVAGALLSGGAIAWFFRSGVEVVQAKDKADAALAMATADGVRILAIETKIPTLESKSLHMDGSISSTASSLAEVVRRINEIDQRHSTEMSSLKSEYSKVDGLLSEIRNRMHNLDNIGQLMESVKNTKEQIQRVEELLTDKHVPRNEMIARFEAIETRITNLFEASS